MRKFALTLALAAFTVMPACLSRGEGNASAAIIKIENFTYSPNPVTIPLGATVTWVNHDVVPHDVVSDDKSFKSKLLEKDEHFSYVFNKRGNYHYVCSIHPKMTATVVVQ